MMKFPTGNQPSVLSASQHFAQVPRAEIQRSVFNRSHGHKTAFNSGYLIPVYADEALPADSFTLKMSSFVRLSTPIVPFMDNLHMSSFFFAIPYRLLWDNFKKFFGEQTDPADSTSFTFPVFTAYAPAAESLSDYLGIPPSGASYPLGAGGVVSHCSLWHRAYNLVWNEWFRDQNLQDSVVVDKDDGPDSISDYVLLKRGKRHDYFTSCLPWTQKNNTGVPVSIGLAGDAPVRGIGKINQVWSAGAVNAYETAHTGTTPYASASYITGSTNDGYYVEEDPDNAGFPGIYADLSSVAGITVNALRLAVQTQKMYERDARGGTRYRELVASHFGVVDPADARFQRPEYLGGGTVPIMLSPVPQTSATAGALATGRLSAVGIGVQNGQGFVKSFAEHCILLGLVCVYADLNYQQGLNRMFSRSSRLDMYWPSLANIGEQAVLNKEIYLQDPSVHTIDGVTPDNEQPFGYQERFAEYRYKPSIITGKMRSNYSTPLDYWHLAQKFTSRPELDDTFIQENPPIDRVVAVNTEPQFFGDFYFDLRCARPMPVFSVPGLVDHF